MPTYTGNNGDNTISGSNGDDTINGNGGDDTLSGGNGDDTIDGGSGNDDIEGGNGGDDIEGGSGEDEIDGGNGDDTIDGGADDDVIYGGNGGDTLQGGGGNDELYGQNGNDFLTGGAGDDLLDGNNGFDIAYYSGAIGEYSFFSAAGYLHVVHLGGAGADGHDRLIRVERLVFADRVINIGGGSNAPVAGDDHVSITEDTGTYSSGAASVKDNDFDFDGDALTVTGGTFVGTYGTLTLNANGTYSYTLNGSAQGLDDGETVTDSFNYVVSDNDGSDTGTLVFHIAGLNDAPVANDDAASTSEDGAAAGNVLANDTDVDVEPLVVANPGTYAGAYGTLVLAADGSYTYAPNAQALDDGEVVSDSFGYTASDGTATDTATLTITVTGLNDAPVANDDAASTTEEAAVSGNVLANDTDVDVEPLTVTTPGTYVGTYGTLVLAADGSYTYTPHAAAQALDDGEVVSDSFGYTASDGTASDTATLTVNVAGLNDAPVANDDAASTSEDAAVSGDVLANDTDVDVEPLVVANPGTYVGAYGTLVLAADGSYTYTPNAQALDDGEVVSDAFGYVASDGTASDTATLTVTVSGLNDAPVANDDTASTTEEAVVSGNVLANDTDVDVEPLTVTSPGTYVGTYGTLALAADGSYTYTPNAAAQALDDGEVVSDSFGYTASDGTDSDIATLTVNVAGLNDAPVANDDAASTSEDAAVSGDVLANDTDVDVEPLAVANPGAYVGAYGTLVLAADGSYTYTPNAAAQALDDGEVVSDAFGYIASDGTASDTATLTVTVNGLNDAPVANDDATSTGENAAVSGNVLTNDTDVDIEPLTVTNPGTYVGAYGTLVLAANGSYTYTPSAAANGLAAGEVAQDVFGYTASDGTASDTATLTVTVNGANDAPTIDAGGTDATGSVTELPNNDPNENAFTHTDSGTIAFDDVDVTDTHTASFTPQGGGYLGTFTLDPVNQAGDTVGWDFSVADSDLDFLDDGETLTQTYTVEVDDGNGGTVTQDVTITLTGESDGPQTEWYIDNSAVGSANLGTEADPFTSIGAFNAAQGTPTGPQVGATVYLLAGTGNYVEADGINLLNDQILVGVADGAVRPTIHATGGGNDGIELAQNNTISGVDIGNVNDVGITDGNGTVGTLTITDVGMNGSGQIIDIDQGGTLNVTLNSVTSLGSNDGAIDLNNVGGTFTVAGATTITGVHSDGGIDITNSSIAANFAGGGLVSTNNAIAVNYVGNTGSLELGGGFDIVTTTGKGLNATGGGTLTATGAGNSVSSLTGTAVTVSGTAFGAVGATFESVSANGAVNGIVLANTGSAGGFHVTGDGGGSNNGSGGTIQNSTGDGILLTNTADFRLGYMNIQNNADNGIGGSGINGFILNRVNVTGNGDSAATDDAGIDIANLTGSASVGSRPTAIIDSVISNNHEFEIQITNTSGTLTNLQVINTVVSSDGTTGAHGNLLNFLAVGTASMGLSVSGSTFDGNTGAGALTATAINVDASGGSIQADIGTSNFIDNNVGVNLSTATTGTLVFDVHDNTLTGNRSAAINLSSTAGATGTIDGTIRDNVVGTFGVAGSGSVLGRGIQVTTSGGGTTNLLIDDNTVQNITSLEGISVVDNVTAGTLNATITDNIIRDIPAARGLNIQTTGAGNTINSSISGNQFINVAGPPGDPNATVLRLNEGAGSALNVTQLQGTAAANAAELDDANGIPSTRISVAGTPQYGQPTPTLPSAPSLPLLAGSDAPGDPVDALTQGDLDLIVAAAIDRWEAAGATADQLAAMEETSVTIGEMTGLYLGSSEPGAILIDSDAAGHGWFVDETPGEDSEFDENGNAIAGGPAEVGIDLLTAVMHELGHQVGLGHDQTELMDAFLQPGERSLPDHVLLASADLLPLGSDGPII